MIKVQQLIYSTNGVYQEGQIGDCWRACVASFLELPIRVVPHFAEIWDKHGPRLATLTYLRFMWEYGYMVQGRQGSYATEKIYPGEDEIYFASGPSPRNPDTNHLVVYRDGEMIHDPHPDGTGITRIDYIEKLIKIK